MDVDSLQHEMKRAMRRFASSVAIVTTCAGSSRFAMVATAVSSLSLDPPSLLVCVNRTASIFPVLAPATPFCVNLLAAHHEEVARHCSTASGEARFGAGRWVRHVNGVPYLEDAQAAVFCIVDGGCDYGSHRIVIGRVSYLSVARDVSPLVHVDGRYVQASAAPAA
jgi:flavin reductase (DIM6/NTAB) family NADH-FMN oxidoreductase RutF